MHANERRERLLELIRARGFASLTELAKEVDVSESTARRDLDLLEEQGVAKRTHGGATYTGPAPKLPHFEQRSHIQLKQQIARTAETFIHDGDTVLLDGGSTTYELARQLINRPLQIVTNSLPVANLFLSSGTADLVILGWYVHARTGVSLGPYTNEMLRKLNVRSAFLSVAGVNDRGFYNSNLLLVETERAMMSSADEVVIMADSTKFGRSSLAHLCEVSAVDKVVSDSQLTSKWQQQIEQAGVDIVIADEEAAEEADGASESNDRANKQRDNEGGVDASKES